MSWLANFLAPYPPSPEQMTEAKAIANTDAVFDLIGDLEQRLRDSEVELKRKEAQAYASRRQLESTARQAAELQRSVDKLQAELLRAQQTIAEQESAAFRTFVEKSSESAGPSAPSSLANEAMRAAADTAAAAVSNHPATDRRRPAAGGGGGHSPAKAKATAAAATASTTKLPVDFYEHVVALESKLDQERERTEELVREVALGQRRQKALERELLRAAQDREAGERRVHPRIAALEQQVNEVQAERDLLKEELRAVNTSARAKTRALAELTEKLAQSEGIAVARDRAETQLRSQIQYTRELEAKLTAADSRDAAQRARIGQLSHEQRVSAGVPFEVWKADRARLTQTLKQAQAECKRLDADLEGHKRLLREARQLNQEFAQAVERRADLRPLVDRVRARRRHTPGRAGGPASPAKTLLSSDEILARQLHSDIISSPIKTKS